MKTYQVTHCFKVIKVLSIKVFARTNCSKSNTKLEKVYYVQELSLRGVFKKIWSEKYFKTHKNISNETKMTP